MKISITRSFSKKVQLKQYEPIDVFCAATIEEDGLPAMDHLDDEAKQILIGLQREMSEALDIFVRQEVDKTLAAIRPPMKDVQGKSGPENKDIAKLNAELDAGMEYPN